MAALEASQVVPKPIEALVESQKGRDGQEDGDIYWKMFEQIPVGIYRTTPDDRLIKANQALADMLGCESVSDLLKAYVSDFYVDIEDRFNHLQKLVHTTTYFAEFKLRRKDGRVIWVRDYPRAVTDCEGMVAYFDGILVDITEQKKVELMIMSRMVI